MFKVRNFLILAFLLAATIAFTWYSFRRANYDANQVENGVDISAPFYETEASAPYGEHSQPGHTTPAENEIKGGNTGTGTLMDSSINEGHPKTDHQGTEGQHEKNNDSAGHGH